MDIASKNKWFTVSWLILLFVLIIFVIYGRHAAHSQSMTYLRDNQTLQQVTKQLSSSNKLDAQSVQLLTSLYNKYPNDYRMIWYMGEMNLKEGKLGAARTYYQTALNMRPFLLKDALFTFQYGGLLYADKSYQDAKKMLKISLNDPNSSKYKSKIKTMLTSIQQVNK